MAEVVIKEKVKDVNVAEFVGKMIARRETERCLTVFFRCTTQQGARTYTNSMKILSFSQDLNRKVNEIPLRVKCKISGYVSSTRRMEKEDDGRENEIIDQYFVLTDIERLDEETPDSNIIEITGPVRRAFVTKGGNVIFIVTSVREEHYVKSLRFSISTKAGADLLPLMAAGTKIHMKGHCSVRPVREETETVYVETIIADLVEKA